MKGNNFEIIAAAQDTGGEAAAGQWYDRAKATYTTLVDAKHAVSSAFQFINVPMGVWVDVRGRVVRPAEPAWTTSRTTKYGTGSITTQGEEYLADLRDWVTKGDKSEYVLSDEEFARRVKPRTPAEMEADASFKLGVWFHENRNDEMAAKYFEHAQKLNPEDWNYHRQEWSFTPSEAGKKWLDKFNSTKTDYYPRLDIKGSDIKAPPKPEQK